MILCCYVILWTWGAIPTPPAPPARPRPPIIPLNTSDNQ